jgi:hypothetical protein
LYDGTRDSSHNYSVTYGIGNVYQTQLDWSHPTLLFNTALLGTSVLGITDEASNNSLWISQFAGSEIADYSMSGVLLSSFTVPFVDITSLALDPADGTLWMGSQSTEGKFYQYSTSGTQLSTVTYANMSGQNTLGGEFAFVVSSPEPASLILFSLGAIGLLAISRRRHKT